MYYRFLNFSVVVEYTGIYYTVSYLNINKNKILKQSIFSTYKEAEKYARKKSKKYKRKLFLPLPRPHDNDNLKL